MTPVIQVHILNHGKIVLSENEKNRVQASREKNVPFLNAFVGARD